MIDLPTFLCNSHNGHQILLHNEIYTYDTFNSMFLSTICLFFYLTNIKKTTLYKYSLDKNNVALCEIRKAPSKLIFYICY